MSQQDVLLEIGTEEMPARFIEGARNQLKERAESWFNEHKIKFKRVITFATPRRLTVWVQGVAERQDDEVEVFRGPAKKIGVDESGQWTKAALGFARSHGVDPSQLYVDTFKGHQYLFIKKQRTGQLTEVLLPGLKRVVESLHFPNNMRWGEHDISFIRPIRWLVALYGEQVIPFEIAGVSTSHRSRGHRFLGKDVVIERPETYVQNLVQQYVQADPEQRRETILDQLHRLEQEKGWQIPVDQELLNEVTYLVEYPTIVWGRFDSAYLELPEDVLITSMKEHQRYFPVKDHQGRLLPYFVTVRNGLPDTQQIVAKGNEKVLRARLEDARFFYEEDKGQEIEAYVSKLENVIFHDQLGSMGDKVRRVKELALALAERVELSPFEQKQLVRAADICKFDLVTQMVYEFPELQGKMGEIYAGLAGETPEVAAAIFEHYLPRFSGDQLPKTSVGAVLAMADKLDSLASFFGINLIPTGSQDPYALRRQAAGLVAITLDRQWPFSISELLGKALTLLEKHQLLKRSSEETASDLSSFLMQRLKNRMLEEGIRHDIIDAIVAVDDRLVAALAKGKILAAEIEQEHFKPHVEALTRVINIAQKWEGPIGQIQPDLFVQDEERQLYHRYREVEEQVLQWSEKGEWHQVLHVLFQLKEPINNYFDQVMVMADEELLRQNRLTMMATMAGLICRYADFRRLILSRPGGESPSS